MPEKIRMLFLCSGNACRSQMAEGWARFLKPLEIEAFSAGISAGDIDPIAVRVMREAGVDISAQHSKHVSIFKDAEFDYVITVCDHVREVCPVYPGHGKVFHHAFIDPPAAASAEGNDEDVLDVYRRVRDEIRDFVASLPGSLN
jgi:arsenate reductase